MKAIIGGSFQVGIYCKIINEVLIILAFWLVSIMVVGLNFKEQTGDTICRYPKEKGRALLTHNRMLPKGE